MFGLIGIRDTFLSEKMYDNERLLTRVSPITVFAVFLSEGAGLYLFANGRMVQSSFSYRRIVRAADEAKRGVDNMSCSRFLADFRLHLITD